MKTNTILRYIIIMFYPVIGCLWCQAKIHLYIVILSVIMLIIARAALEE